MKRRVFMVGTLGLCGSAALAQGSPATGAQTGRNQGYSGGGIRGSAIDPPDGWLVTPAEAVEFGGEAGYNEPAALRPRAVVPLIDLLRPEPAADLKVKAPFAIAVQFRGQADAPIEPATFKVLYGALKIDITQRITKFVTVTREGFSLENANIPPGKHRLILQVQDAKQRLAERELRVEVE